MAMARLERIEISDDAVKPAGSAAAGLTRLEIYLPLGGIVDLDSERERLGREIEKLIRDSAKIEERLGSGSFIERAPADVVQRERERLVEMSDRRGRLERILEDLR
jgi:valyl-tRNA synthetase